MPVLPAVPSTSVSPGLIFPAFSADSIIDRPMRSLIEPPGLAFSSLRKSSHFPQSRFCAFTIGVSPISSSTLLWIAMQTPKKNGPPERGRIGEIIQHHPHKTLFDQPENT